MKRRRIRVSELVAVAVLAVFVVAHRAGVFRGLGPETDISEEGPRHACQLLKVVDGDTIVVRWREKDETVRLLRVNTPERGMPGHEESADFLRNLLEGRRIELEFKDAQSPTRDRYQRLLAYVFADGLNANVEIVRAGWSRFWTRYGRGKYGQAFEEAELDAKGNNRGLMQNLPRENQTSRGDHPQTPS